MPRKKITRKKAIRRAKKKVSYAEPDANAESAETPITLDQFKQYVRIVSTGEVPKEP